MVDTEHPKANQKNLLISVVVPSFNYAQFIDKCLNSIHFQDYPFFEVLICDGGSTDGSLSIIKNFTNADNRFKLISKKDAGQADAIKKGFDVAVGDVFAYLNADDVYLHANVFSRIIKEFSVRNSLELITCGGSFLDYKGASTKKVNYHYHPFGGIHLYKYRTAVLQPATFWKRNVFFKGVWRTDLQYTFDVVFFYFAFLKNNCMYIDIPVAGYRIHSDNKSVGLKPDRIIELAMFEGMKFGNSSFRKKYLLAIAKLVLHSDRLFFENKILRLLIYRVVNSISFISYYRLPGI